MSNEEVFCERQRGGLCRLHALNNALGRVAYSDSNFEALCQEYNKLYGYKPDCREWDAVVSTQEPVFAYALRTRHGIGGLIYYSGKTCFGDAKLEEVTDPEMSQTAFVYNAEHVWVMRKHRGEWYEIDSMRGVVHLADVQEFALRPGLVFYILLGRAAMQKTQQLAAEYIRAEIKPWSSNRMSAVRVWTDAQWRAHRNLGKLEVPLSLFYRFEEILVGRWMMVARFDEYLAEYQRNPGECHQATMLLLWNAIRNA
jgi:hypothetical protein